MGGSGRRLRCAGVSSGGWSAEVKPAILVASALVVVFVIGIANPLEAVGYNVVRCRPVPIVGVEAFYPSDEDLAQVSDSAPNCNVLRERFYFPRRTRREGVRSSLRSAYGSDARRRVTSSPTAQCKGVRASIPFESISEGSIANISASLSVSPALAASCTAWSAFCCAIPQVYNDPLVEAATNSALPPQALALSDSRC
jgi:hypothetical protein